VASELGLIVVTPDTSPRGADVPDDASTDLGQGASFYVNATQEPWAKHYRMYDYVTQELPALLKAHLPVNGAQSIFGHSMGGHGALVCALKNPGQYRSVSAFAPITNPSACPWGQKAFRAYLGEDPSAWSAYDTCELIKTAPQRLPLLIDQGTADEFIERELMPQRLEAVCQAAGHPLELRRQAGYDHSYYFIASFMQDHLLHHARALRAKAS
jgi:S-formylglutathione hydrolase